MSEISFKQQYEVSLIKAKQDLVLVEQVINNPYDVRKCKDGIIL